VGLRVPRRDHEQVRFGLVRGNMEPSDYKHVALGLVFLKYISNAFEAKHAALLADDPAAAEDKDEYLADHLRYRP
jgi:type I restriction enzyme M protein